MKKDVTFVISAVDKVSNAMRQIDRNTSKTTKSLNNFVDAGRLMKGVAIGIGAVATAAIAATGAIAGMTSKGLDQVDSIAKTSDKLGIMTEELIGLQHAAGLTGNSTKTLDTALQRMVRRIAEAAQGTGEAKNAIAELGLNAQQLAKQSPDEQFRQLADAMKEVDTQGDRVRLAMKLFDTEGVGLVNTLKLGSEGLREATRETEALGLAFSRLDASKVEEANDNMKRLDSLVDGLSRQFAIELAPAISKSAETLLDFNRQSEFLPKVATFVGDITLGFAAMALRVEAATKGIVFGFAEIRASGLELKAEALRAVDFVATKVAQFLDRTFEGVVSVINVVRKLTGSDPLNVGLNLGDIDLGISKLAELEAAQARGAAALAGVDAGFAFQESERAVERLAARYSNVELTGPSDGLLGVGFDPEEASAALTKMEGEVAELTAATTDLGNEMQITGDIIDDVITPAPAGTLAAIREQISRLNKELDTTQIGSERFRELKREISSLEAQTRDSTDIMGESMERFRDVGISAIDEFVETGKFSIRSFVVDALQELAKVQLQSAFNSALSGIGSSAIFSGIGSFLGFDGGGFTGSGARSGGLDGKGGFLGVLHPNETVVDHTRGQSTGGTTINQNLNIQPGMSVEMIPQILEAAKEGTLSALQDMGGRGGQRASSLGF